MHKRIRILLFLIGLAAPFLHGTEWYVRPYGGSYGSEDGSSYSNAWDGLESVTWGAGGVQPGDTLWVCGLHISTYSGGSVGVDIGPITSGLDESTRVMIRGDYSGDPGIIWQACRYSHENWQYEGNNTWSITIPAGNHSDWFFEDVTAASWVVLDIAASLADCKASPGSHYSVDYDAGSKLFIHCSDNGNPTGRILANRWGYNFKMNAAKYITFLNIEFYSIYRMFISRPAGEYCTYVRWEGCTLWYGEKSTIEFREGCHHFEFINCDIGWGNNGPALSENVKGGDAPHDYVFRGCYFHDFGTRRPDLDSHGFSAQGSYNGLIENNEFYNCGTIVCFYAYSGTSIRNTTVRWNYIHDAHTLGGANGHGIAFNCNGDAFDDKTGNKVHGNIVTNCVVGYRCIWEDYIEFFNNVAYNCSEDSFYLHRNEIGQNIKLRNNISLNPGRHHILFSTNMIEAGSYTLDSDNNLFYPTSADDFFFFDKTSGLAATNFSEWRSLSKPGCRFDPNGISADPLFTNTSGSYSLDTDFRLRAQSPAVDAGKDVGLTKDYDANPVPKGFAPDIGAFECIKPLYVQASATPRSGFVPLRVDFQTNAVGDYPPFNFLWDFGDGQTSTMQNPSHVYNSIGNYTVTLNARDSSGNSETASLTIVSRPPTHVLSLAAVTGQPAPGQGGVTNPLPGVHSFPTGSTQQVSTTANTGYRFSKWTGDINISDVYKTAVAVSMDTDKNLTANFYTRCGDVNGDLSITPADAQLAFDIYLGKRPSASEAQLENADVNCDGTKLLPRITPADAQAIFNRYLGVSGLPSNCSGNSRTAQAAVTSGTAKGKKKILPEPQLKAGEFIYVPVRAEKSGNIQAFGFDLIFPAEFLSFQGIVATGISDTFTQVDGFEISRGRARIGGYNTSTAEWSSSKSLVSLVFEVIAETDGPLVFQISNAFDDLESMGIIFEENPDHSKTQKIVIK